MDIYIKYRNFFPGIVNKRRLFEGSWAQILSIMINIALVECTIIMQQTISVIAIVTTNVVRKICLLIVDVKVILISGNVINLRERRECNWAIYISCIAIEDFSRVHVSESTWNLRIAKEHWKLSVAQYTIFKLLQRYPPFSYRRESVVSFSCPFTFNGVELFISDKKSM